MGEGDTEYRCKPGLQQERIVQDHHTSKGRDGKLRPKQDNKATKRLIQGRWVTQVAGAAGEVEDVGGREVIAESNEGGGFGGGC